MRKQIIRTSRTKNLFMIYDDKRCFYIVSVGKIKVNKKRSGLKALEQTDEILEQVA